MLRLNIQIYSWKCSGRRCNVGSVFIIIFNLESLFRPTTSLLASSPAVPTYRYICKVLLTDVSGLKGALFRHHYLINTNTTPIPSPNVPNPVSSPLTVPPPFLQLSVATPLPPLKQPEVQTLPTWTKHLSVCKFLFLSEFLAFFLNNYPLIWNTLQSYVYRCSRLVLSFFSSAYFLYRVTALQFCRLFSPCVDPSNHIAVSHIFIIFFVSKTNWRKYCFLLYMSDYFSQFWW